MAKGIKEIEEKIKELEAKKKALEQDELLKLGAIVRKYAAGDFADTEKMVAELRKAIK
jgi:acyl-CoA-binding protein